MDNNPDIFAFSEKKKKFYSDPAFLFGIFLFLLFVLGSAIAVQRSLPGSILYPIKISLYEPFVAYVSFEDEDEKIARAIILTSRRLAEAERLIDKKQLTDEKEKNIENRVKEYSEFIFNATTLLEQMGQVAQSSELRRRYDEALFFSYAVLQSKTQIGIQSSSLLQTIVAIRSTFGFPERSGIPVDFTPRKDPLDEEVDVTPPPPPPPTPPTTSDTSSSTPSESESPQKEEPDPVPEPEPQPQPEPDPEPEPTPQPEPEPTPQPEPDDTGSSSGGAPPPPPPPPPAF